VSRYCPMRIIDVFMDCRGGRGGWQGERGTSISWGGGPVGTELSLEITETWAREM